MKYIIRDRVLIILILFGLVLRLSVISLPGFKFDMDSWFAWAIRLNQVGFADFYSDQIWTNYTPGYLYILKLLGFFKIIFSIPDNAFYFVLKIPSIAAEIILSILIYRLIYIKSVIWARISAGLVLLNPSFIFNSSIWGQIDGLLALIMLLSIYFLIQKKLILSSFLLGLAFLVKPQSIGVLPILLLFLIRNFSVKHLIQTIMPIISVILILSLPFYTSHLLGLPQLFYNMIGDYSYTSLFAYNFWGWVGFWIKDSIVWNNLSYYQWGYILFGLYWLLLSFLFLKKKLSIYSLATLAMLGFFFLPSRIHDRYLYPGLFFLIVSTGISKSKSLLILTGLLTLIHFLNLYYVYVYYNEIYLKLPRILYNINLYNYLDGSGKFLSLLSTVLFIIITFVVIKNDFNLKKS